MNILMVAMECETLADLNGFLSVNHGLSVKYGMEYWSFPLVSVSFIFWIFDFLIYIPIRGDSLMCFTSQSYVLRFFHYFNLLRHFFLVRLFSLDFGLLSHLFFENLISKISLRKIQLCTFCLLAVRICIGTNS